MRIGSHSLRVVARIGERSGHHADHLGRHAVERDHATKDRRITTESRLPVTVRQHDYPSSLRSVLFRSERTAERWLHPEQGKEAAADCGCRDSLGVGARRADGGGAHLIGGHLTDRAGMISVIDVLGIRQDELRKVESAFGIESPPDRNQALGFRKRQRFQHDAVDHAEDGGVGADTDRERQHDEDRKRRLPAQQSQRIPRILEQSEHGSSFVHERVAVCCDRPGRRPSF